MRYLVLCCLATLAFPSLADAMPTGVPYSWCDYESPSTCYTYEAGDEYRGGESAPNEVWYSYRMDLSGQRGFSTSSIGCSLVNIYGSSYRIVTSTSCTKMRGWYQRHYYSRYHRYNHRDPWMIASYATFRSEDGVISPANSNPDVQVYPLKNRSDCQAGPLQPFITFDADGVARPTPDAPADFIADCFASTVTPVDPVDPVTTQPSEEESCSTMRIGNVGTVAVRRVRVACAPARTIVRREIVGSGNRGWACIAKIPVVTETAFVISVRCHRNRSSVVMRWKAPISMFVD